MGLPSKPREAWIWQGLIPQGKDVWGLLAKLQSHRRWQGQGCAEARNPLMARDQPTPSTLLVAVTASSPIAKQQSQQILRYRNAFISPVGWK